jgi:orotidine-5'-phosphate decarboxylase
MSLKGKERIFVALDTPDVEGARRLVGRLEGQVGGFKIGLQLFTVGGAAIVEEVRRSGAAVFLDLKLHDIPNTVAGAAAAAARMGVSFFTIHATGGAKMIARGVEAAAEAAEAEGLPSPTALAVTVLTSHDDDELHAIGLEGPCGAAVRRLAALARDAGAGGLVCSALEVEAARALFPGGTLVVPGIRPAGKVSGGDDQTRVATPAKAVASGADRLVIGRPITRAEDPAAAAAAIAAEIDG